MMRSPRAGGANPAEEAPRHDPVLIVVGGGIGGAAAALRAAQYHLPTVWVLGDRETHRASRAAYVRNIDNMLGVHPGIVQEKIESILRPAHGAAAEAVAAAHLHISTADLVANARARIAADYADHVRVVEERAAEAARSGDAFSVRLGSGATIEAPFLILATGVMDRQPVVHKLKGERDLSGIQWVYPYANQETFLYCIRCEGHLTAGRRVAVIGSGDGAAEIALMLRERYGSEVLLLTAGEPAGWSADRARLLDLEGVKALDGRLVEIHGERQGTTLRGFTLEGGTRVEVDLALVAMGLYRVYNDLARSLGAALEERDEPPERGHVLIDRRGETSVANLFAVGDMARRRDEGIMKQVYTAQEYAVRAVDAIDARRRKAQRAALLSGA